MAKPKMPSYPAHRVTKVADGQFRGENRQISETNAGWLEMEWSEGQTKEAGRSDHSEIFVDRREQPPPKGHARRSMTWRSEVRVFV